VTPTLITAGKLSSILRDQMTLRRLRLVCGLIMLCYLTLHLTMHALGNISFQARQWGTRIHDFVWHSTPGTVALYGAFAIHFTLALYALYQRRSFRMGCSLASPFYLYCSTISQRIPSAAKCAFLTTRQKIFAQPKRMPSRPTRLLI